MPSVMQLPTEDNRRWSRNFVNGLSLSINTVGCRLSGLNVARLQTSLKALGSIPTYWIVGTHC